MIEAAAGAREATAGALTPPAPAPVVTPASPAGLGASDEAMAPANGPAEQQGQPGEQGEPRLAWLRQINFRARLSALVAMAVGLAVALAALVSYFAVSRQMEQQASSTLQSSLGSAPGLIHMGPVGPSYDSNDLIAFQDRTGDSVQLITPTQAISPSDRRLFPLTPGARQAMQDGPNGNAPIETVTAKNGQRFLLASVPTQFPGVVVQVGYPLSGVDNTLAYLRLVLILVALGGVALAATMGWAVGKASMGPVEDLTEAAEHVAETQDLTAGIDNTGNDELGRLARSFNAMLAALSASRQQQAQLVSDAGHELRTPLTSLRTNIEFLMKAKDLAGPDRDELLADVEAQLQELTTLVGDLVDLAAEDERPDVEPELVAFDGILERAVERAQRRAMSVHFDVSLQPGQVRAHPAMLERAVMNVLDNAAKWSPSGGHVGVLLEAGDTWRLTVTDQGPGIGPQDLPHIFDRFYRAPSARSMPGSGLGLSIVKRAVSSHGGFIEVTNRAGGGTQVLITLPRDEAQPAPEGSSRWPSPAVPV
ncbi:MAG: HAMP domain-containing sensor histidine kinase [Acidimicrobiales bacterium]